MASQQDILKQANNKVWSLERYARLLQDREQLLLPQSELSKPKGPAGGSWKHYHSSADVGIHVALVDDNHLMISSADQIFESVSLWEAKKWMKCVTKGDSALFICRLNDNNRRFRVQFSPLCHGGSSIEACEHFASILSGFVSTSEMPLPSTKLIPTSQSAPDPHQVMSSSSQGEMEVDKGCSDPSRRSGELMAVSDIAKVVQTGGKSLGVAYGATNFPTEHLESFIRLCLTDANFPSFVEAVESELKSITRTGH